MTASPSPGAAFDVGVWLSAIGLEQYEAAFRENAIDGAVLPTLTANDLREMGVRCDRASPPAHERDRGDCRRVG